MIKWLKFWLLQESKDFFCILEPRSPKEKAPGSVHGDPQEAATDRSKKGTPGSPTPKTLVAMPARAVTVAGKTPPYPLTPGSQLLKYWWPCQPGTVTVAGKVHPPHRPPDHPLLKHWWLCQPGTVTVAGNVSPPHSWPTDPRITNS